MTYASELDVVSPHCAIWHRFDNNVKTELFSTAIAVPEGVVVVDPIDLTNDSKTQLESLGRIIAVVVTNANHVRSADLFARRYSAPVFTSAGLQGEFLQGRTLTGSGSTYGLEAVVIDGGPAGEIALYDQREGGTLIVGDALINFDPYGFTVLPPKYCTSQRRLLQSLRRLLEFDFARLFFAHGYPITAHARERLAALLLAE